MSSAATIAAGARRTSRRLGVAVALGAAVIAVALGAWLWPAARGYMLFNGHAGLEAKIQGGVALPAAAAACANCHDGAATGGPRPIARLDRKTLSTPRTPRGGAPVFYDEAAFCRLLREGVDPASVLLNRLMPRFTIPDADCAALFAYTGLRP